MVFRGYDEYRAVFDRYFNEIKSSRICGGLSDGMYYALDGGKRLRPCIMLAAAEYLGGDIRRVLPYALALEYLHTASLIHDDLPALDNDRVRHGKPSNWAVFGENAAVLHGDAMINAAYEIILQAVAQDKTPSSAALAASALAESAGMFGMLGGQFLDVTCEGLSDNRELLDQIQTQKTAQFFIAAVSVPAVLCQARPTTADALKKAAFCIGRAFQIADDLIDAGYGSKPADKTVDKDASAQKISYPNIVGVACSFEAIRCFVKECRISLANLDKPFDALDDLAEYVSQSVVDHR